MTSSPDAVRTREDLRALLGLTHHLATVPTAVVGPDERDGDVVRHRLTLEVDGRTVPCLVVRPATGGPWPGVVAVHQHNTEFHLGKSEPAGLAGDEAVAYGVVTARAGALVVMPDLSGFEERSRPGMDGRVAERLEAFHLLTHASTLQARHVEDVAACVSWLEASSDVDGGIGVIGHSLGGQVAFFAAACDPRVRAAVLSCGIGTVESFYRADLLHNPAWYVPGLTALGDTPVVAALLEGQRAWVSAGERDELFPLDGVHEVVAGFAPGVAELHLHPGGHALPAGTRATATAWLVDALSR